MRLSGYCAVFFILILFSCNKKKATQPVISELLIENFDFTKDAVFDTLSVPQHLRKIVKDISALNIYETAAGAKGSIETPPNFKNFEKLRAEASEHELWALIDNENKAVAVYAAVGLLDKNNQYTVPVFQKILTRKGTVAIKNGCILSDDHPAEPVYWKHYYKLKPEELSQIQI